MHFYAVWGNRSFYTPSNTVLIPRVRLPIVLLHQTRSSFDKKPIIARVSTTLRSTYGQCLRDDNLPPLHSFHRLKHLLAEASDDFDSRV